MIQTTALSHVVGNTTTAAVLCCYCLSGFNANQITGAHSNYPSEIRLPKEISFDYYKIVNKDNKDQATSMEQIAVLHKFASNILENIKDLDADFSKTIDENFWDLI